MMDDDWEYETELEHEYRSYGRPVDHDGKPVKRTKTSYPYAYTEFVLHRMGRNEDVDRWVYTDRMAEWDHKKYCRLYKEHMENRRFDNARPNAIQAFLRAYNDDPKLQLIIVMEWCNQTTGYPTWSLHYKEGLGQPQSQPTDPELETS